MIFSVSEDTALDELTATVRLVGPGGQRDEALAAEHDMGVFETAEGKAEVVKPVRQRRARHGNAEARQVGEIRQSLSARLMRLAEHHLGASIYLAGIGGS